MGLGVWVVHVLWHQNRPRRDELGTGPHRSLIAFADTFPLTFRICLPAHLLLTCVTFGEGGVISLDTLQDTLGIIWGASEEGNGSRR